MTGEREGLAELHAAIEAGLRKCRVEDAPVSLIKEHDLFHVTHMVADALADLLAARDRRVRAEAWAEGHKSHMPVAEFGDTPCFCANPYADRPSAKEQP